MKNQKKYSKKASFGKNEIVESRIFLRRNNTFAMVNIKPKLPGHVLVKKTWNFYPKNMCSSVIKETSQS